LSFLSNYLLTIVQRTVPAIKKPHKYYDIRHLPERSYSTILAPALMKSRLLTLALIFTLFVSFAAPGAAPALAGGPLDDDLQVVLEYDSSGGLWVSTAAYSWNIIQGDAILAGPNRDGRPWVEAAEPSGRPLVESLFLHPGQAPALTAQILFSLPGEAAVQVEHSHSWGREVLYLTFSGEGGLIGLSHSLTGEPPAVEAGLPRLRLAGVQEKISSRSGVLPAQDGALHPGEFIYWDESGVESGVAVLGRSEAPSQRYILLYWPDPDGSLSPLVRASARLQLALPDLDVASIARLPRYDYDQPKNNPAEGDPVVFSARIANRGGVPSGPFSYTWSVDGRPAASGQHPGLNAAQSDQLSFQWTWQPGEHTVALSLEGQEGIVEVSAGNNRLEDRTDALALGLWVEQSVYDWFNLQQAGLALGGVSWDNWAQRQVRVWNKMFAEAVTPLTPQGVIERVRLDKVVVVPDGWLPDHFPSNYPQADDRSVDLMWGFPCELVDGCQIQREGLGLHYPLNLEAQLLEYALIHELSHARYLDDLYGINIGAEAAYLVEAAGPGDSSLRVDREVDSIPGFQPPVYLAAQGELIICERVERDRFFDCQRGAEGTTARQQPAGVRVNRAAVRLQDGQGSLVMGSEALPLIGWEDHLYLNRYLDDLMSGGRVYQQHSAYALNRIAGRRAACGNFNAPCNIGEYQNDMPSRNILALTNAGLPAAGAVVEVYRAIPLENVWYGKTFLNRAEAVYTADGDGQVDLGPFPFDRESGPAHTASRVILLKISHAGTTAFHFFDITLANEAFWQGNRERAVYFLEIQGDNQLVTRTGQ
jgi:hypothetical protein